MTAIISQTERHRRAEIIGDPQAVALQEGKTLDDRRDCPERATNAAAASECAIVRAELQALRVELAERWHGELTAIGEVLAERIDQAIDQVVMLNERLQTELWNLVKTQLGALQARVDGVLPDTKSASPVARERADEVNELPDPLPSRRAIN
jgi:hypothetical protein